MNETSKKPNNEGKKKLVDPKFAATIISSISHGYDIIQGNKTVNEQNQTTQ